MAKVLFSPGDGLISSIFNVTDKPVRIIGLLPMGDKVKVWRQYDDLGDDCEYNIPDVPVMCCDSCDQLSLFTESYADCYTGALVQSEILIQSSGRYYLEYVCAPVEPLPPPLTCGSLEAFIAWDDGDDTIRFDMIEAPNGFNLEGVVLSDFKASGYEAISIIQDEGTLIVEFPVEAVSDATLFEFKDSTNGALTNIEGTHRLCDFSIEIIYPTSYNLIVESDCTEVPDNVFVWMRDELIERPACT